MTSAVKKDAKSYRTIDLVTIATLGVAFGVIYWGWGKVYEAPSETLGLIYPPLKGLTASPWLIAGVLGALVIRKPGAALATEFLAAAVSTLVLGGTQWGWTVLASGLIQGLGAEVAFLLFMYRRWSLAIACLAGVLAGAFEAVYEWYSYYPDWGFDHKLAYLGFFALSGAVVAGLGSWLLVRALSRAGVLDAFPAGREHAGEV